MAATLLLSDSWDLSLDVAGNIALAPSPLNFAQDAASAIRLFLGEYFWDTTIGVPYLKEILGKRLILPLLKETLVNAALTVPDVASAAVFISSFSNRVLAGQVQVISSSGQLGAANFVTVMPQGI